MRIYQLFLLGFIVLACTNAAVDQNPPINSKIKMKVKKTDAEWKSQLSDQQFSVLRQKGTERAFTGAYWNNHEKGIYTCAGCGNPLFKSETKFDSGTGWPSFYDVFTDTSVAVNIDKTHGMVRSEVVCARCEGHLGHVFNDGPKPTGLRYCMNSISMNFEKE